MFAWYSAGMKRKYVLAATAVVAASGVLPQEREVTCDVPPCATDQNVTMPEPSHPHEEGPGCNRDAKEVWLMSHSPIISAKPGSGLHTEYLAWLSETGMSIDGLA